jgi:hypothetical protein
MKTIKFLTYPILLLLFISCSSKKAVTSKKDINETEYDATSVGEMKVLSKDGSKIIKIPVIIFRGTGTKNNSKAIAEESAKTRVSNSFARSIKNTLIARFDERTASIDGNSAIVIRDRITSVTNTMIKSLKIGKVKNIERNGYYISEVEVYMSGIEYKNLMTNSAKKTKEILISDEKIQNTKDIFKAVDQIFDGKIE